MYFNTTRPLTPTEMIDFLAGRDMQVKVVYVPTEGYRVEKVNG